MQKELRITGPKGYLVWLALNQPAVYQKVRAELIKKLPQNLSGLGYVASDPTLVTIGLDPSLVKDPVINAAPQGASSTWSDTLKNIVSAIGIGYATKKQIDSQAELNRIQLDRVRQGLPPMNVDPATMGLTTASASIGFSSGTQKMLMFGGLAFLGVWLLTSLRGGRAAHS